MLRITISYLLIWASAPRPLEQESISALPQNHPPSAAELLHQQYSSPQAPVANSPAATIIFQLCLPSFICSRGQRMNWPQQDFVRYAKSQEMVSGLCGGDCFCSRRTWRSWIRSNWSINWIAAARFLGGRGGLFLRSWMTVGSRSYPPANMQEEILTQTIACTLRSYLNPSPSCLALPDPATNHFQRLFFSSSTEMTWSKETVDREQYKLRPTYQICELSSSTAQIADKTQHLNSVHAPYARLRGLSGRCSSGVVWEALLLELLLINSC